MTKDKLQQELLKKIKPGIKPSELKNQNKGVLHDFNLPPSDEQSPSSFNKPDEGYESEVSSPSLKPRPEPFILLDESKRKQPQPKDKTLIQQLQAQNKSLIEKINQLEKQAKSTAKTNPEGTLPTFTCSSCSRTLDLDLIRLAKKSGKKICRNCTLHMLKRANQITGKHIVLKIKKSPEPTPTETFTCQTCHQSQSGEPHQVHITNYQDQGIVPQQLTSICSPCLEDKVILANFYCPRTSEGRDTYSPREPQFDCHCLVSPERKDQ